MIPRWVGPIILVVAVAAGIIGAIHLTSEVSLEDEDSRWLTSYQRMTVVGSEIPGYGYCTFAYPKGEPSGTTLVGCTLEADT